MIYDNIVYDIYITVSIVDSGSPCTSDKFTTFVKKLYHKCKI